MTNAVTGFWDVIDEQLNELTTTRNVDDVMTVLATANNPYGDPSISGTEGFFAGGGGDKLPDAALDQAGWTYVWRSARYHWCMESPDGGRITYIEGDVYRGDVS